MAYFPATPPQHTTGNAVTTAGDSSGMYQGEYCSHTSLDAGCTYTLLQSDFDLLWLELATTGIITVGDTAGMYHPALFAVWF
jgi:hypothetical protein